MKTMTLIAIIEGIFILILLVLIFLKKIGRPLTETEVRIRMKNKEKKLQKRKVEAEKRRAEEVRKYNELKELEEVAKSLKPPITILNYNYDSFGINYLSLRGSGGLMLNVENINFNEYKVNPCPTVYALTRSCSGKNHGDKI